MTYNELGWDDKNGYLHEMMKALFLQVGNCSADLSDLNVQLNEVREDFGRARKKDRKEIEHLLEEKAHLVALLGYRDREIEKLQNDLLELKAVNQKLEGEIRSLTGWLNKLQKYVEQLFRSNRWKIGKSFGELKRRLLFKPQENLREKDVNKIFKEYNSWQKKGNKTGQSG